MLGSVNNNSPYANRYIDKAESGQKQELSRVRSDEGKRKEAEQRLAQIEAELSAKDNDAYRKANTSFTSGPTAI